MLKYGAAKHPSALPSSDRDRWPMLNSAVTKGVGFHGITVAPPVTLTEHRRVVGVG